MEAAEEKAQAQYDRGMELGLSIGGGTVRQQFLRLVDEAMDDIRQDLAARREEVPLSRDDLTGNFGLASELAALAKVRSWLAGEGENA